MKLIIIHQKLLWIVSIVFWEYLTCFDCLFLMFAIVIHNQEINLNVHETKMRNAMIDLLDPLYAKAANQKSALMELHNMDSRLGERIEGLEEIVLNIKKENDNPDASAEDGGDEPKKEK